MSHSLQHSHCLCKLDYRRAITSSISNGIFMSCRDEHEHYSNRANWLRAAVLGANDGLVSVASIMLGVGAGSTDQHTLLLSGVSALVAGTRTFLSPSSSQASAMLPILLAHPTEPHVPICQYSTCLNVSFPLLTYCSFSTPFLTLQCLCTPCWQSEHAISTAGALIMTPGKYISVVIYPPAAIPGVCKPEGCIAG